MSEFYRKKKKFLKFPILAFILLLLVLSSTHVFSSGQLNGTISFGGDEWDLNESFNREWITTEQEVRFVLDLSEHYQKETNPEQPFELNAAHNDQSKDSSIVASEGKYSVSYSLEEDGVLDLELNFLENNEWDISVQHNPIEFSIIKDTEAPKIEIRGVEDQEVFYKNNVDFEIDIKDQLVDAENSYVSLNGIEINQELKNDGTKLSINHEVEEDGVYHLKVFASDRAGNKTGEELTFYLNNDGPDFELRSGGQPLENDAYANDGAIELRVNNDAPIENVVVDIIKNGDDYKSNPEIQIDHTTAIVEHEFDDGFYQISATIEDKVSGEEHTIKAIGFVVDETAPEIEMSELAEYYNEAVDVEVKVTEEHYETNDVNITILKEDETGEFVEFDDFFPDWNNTDQKSSQIYQFTEDGRYQMLVNATDKAGNQAEQVQRKFVIHRSAPELTVEGVEHNNHYNQDLAVDLSIRGFLLDQSESDIVIEQWDEEKEGFTPYETEEELITEDELIQLATIFTEEGLYQVHLTGQDTIGNVAEPKTVQFTIDKIAPVVAIEGVPDEAVFGDHQELTFTVTEKYFETNDVELKVFRNDRDYTRQVEDRLDGEWARQGEESVATYETNREGDYVFTLTATDKAGNQSETAEVSFVVDSSVPTIDVDGVEDQVHHDEDRLIEIEITDRNLVEDQIQIDVLKNGEPYDVGEFEFDEGWFFFNDSIATLEYQFTEEGTYDVFIEATDSLDYRAEKNLSFTIDKTDPIIELGKEIPSFVTSGRIEEQGINQLIPIEIVEKHLDEKELTIVKTTPSGNEEIFTAEDFGIWEQDEATYSFIFNDDFFTEDGHYQLSIEGTDFAGQITADGLSFTIDDTKPDIRLSPISRYNDGPVTQDIEIEEFNYQGNDIILEIYRENNQGNFEKYDHPQSEQWSQPDEVTRISLDFNEDGTYRVEMQAVDAAGNNATPMTQTFTVDQVDPRLSLTGVSNDQHYNQNRQVSVSVEDRNIDPNQTNLTIYKFNQRSSDFEQYRSVPNLSYNRTRAQWEYVFSTDDEGVFRIDLNATDRAGNQSEHDSVTFTIDQTAPVLAANQLTDGEYYRSNQTAEFIVRERYFTGNTVDFEVTRNGQNVTSTVEGQTGSGWRYAGVQSQLNHDFNQDGAYTVSMSAFDEAGNTASPVEKSFVIDTVNPVIHIDGVENNDYYNTDQSVAITVQDVNLDRQTIQVTRDGVNYPIGDFSITNNRYQESLASLNYTFTEEGEYHISVDAVDQADNRDQSEISFTIDKTPPEITPTMGEGGTIIEDGAFINQIFTPVFELDQPADQIDSVILNGGANIAGNVSIAGQEMTYNYTVVASDPAGNTTELTVSFTVDTTNPELAISGIIDGYFNEAMTPIVDYADDNLDDAASTVTLNGQPFTNGTILDQEQDYVLTASIADLAGNVSNQTVVFTIDKTEPIINFSTPLSNQYFNEMIIPEFFIEDMTDYDIIALTLNGEPYEMGQPIETERKHVLYFEIMDRAGNINQLTVEFMLDTTPPEFIIEGAEQNERYYEAVELMISLLNQEDVIQSITVNGEDYQGEVIENEDGETLLLNFEDPGNYHILTQAYDLAGNLTSYDFQFEIAEKTMLMELYENRPLFASSIIGLLAITGTGGALIYQKRKKVE